MPVVFTEVRREELVKITSDVNRIADKLTHAVKTMLDAKRDTLLSIYSPATQRAVRTDQESRPS